LRALSFAIGFALGKPSSSAGLNASGQTCEDVRTPGLS
jgi:hypothetical protein